MKYNKGKLYWVARYASKNVVCVPWDEQKEEYYTFVKREVASGCHQISITSEIMLKVIKQFVLLGNWSVDKIEMMEEDYELNEILNNLIENSHSCPKKIIELLDYIQTIVEESSIEIKRVYLSGRDNGNKLSAFFIQVNGIIGVYNNNDQVINILRHVIKEYI